MMRLAAIVVGFACVGWFVGGWLGAAAGFATSLLAIARPATIRHATWMAPVVLAVATITEATTSSNRVTVFVDQRFRSHQIGVVALLVWLAFALLVERDANQPDIDRSATSPLGRHRAVLVLGLVVAVGASWMLVDP